jgi:integrase
VNKTLTLLRYAAIEDKGWRRGQAVLGKTGRIKPNAMMIGGVEVDAPKGRYQLRRYEGTRVVYVELGNDPTDALNRYRAEESKINAMKVAIEAGLVVVNDTPDNPARKTIQRYATDFVVMHRALPHRSDDSVRVYEQVTATFIEQIKARYPEEITKDDVIRWHGWMRKTKVYSDRTAATHYIALRSFLKYCKLVPGDIIPQGTNKLLKTFTKKTVNTYTPEVVETLIQASIDENRALLWDFACKTGLRDSELQMVTRYDLHGLNGNDPLVHVKERDEYGRIKDAEERVVELHPSLVPKLKKWLRDNPTKVLVFGTDRDKPDTKMLKALKVTARRAGLNCGRCKGCVGKRNECGDYTLHRFRRTYVTRMLRATQGDLRSVMARSGHSDIESVMRYLEPSSHIRQAVAAAF